MNKQEEREVTPFMKKVGEMGIELKELVESDEDNNSILLIARDKDRTTVLSYGCAGNLIKGFISLFEKDEDFIMFTNIATKTHELRKLLEKG